jgi:hemolysin activation/secretion protein
LGTTTAFDAAVNADAPNSDYFLWRGQAQWVRLLAADTLILLRTDLQLADRPLFPLEQFVLGGFGSWDLFFCNLHGFLTVNG